VWVVLSHIGMTESQKLTIEAPGIDVMVFGHQPACIARSRRRRT
jgi:2',3'-cyclic-nucleotide 2'-phosphodiesterase (5'-nucleotidase family)